jgi:hypothetical protein
MASKEEIKKAILASVGNPESGPIAQNADKMAEAVCCIDDKPKVEEKAEPKASKPVKETRVQEASEIR